MNIYDRSRGSRRLPMARNTENPGLFQGWLLEIGVSFVNSKIIDKFPMICYYQILFLKMVIYIRPRVDSGFPPLISAAPMARNTEIQRFFKDGC